MKAIAGERKVAIGTEEIRQSPPRWAVIKEKTNINAWQKWAI